MGCLRFTSRRVGEGINAVAERKGNGIRFNIGIICSVGTRPFLSAAPDVLWVSPEMAKELFVRSNTMWEII